MPARIIALGDPSAAARWIGAARRLLAKAVRMRVLALQRQMDSQTWIRVETSPTHRIWIQSSAGAWYQFIHTTHRPNVSFLGDVPLLWGSGVQLRLPSVKAGQPVAWTIPPVPTGSAVEGDAQSPWPLRLGRQPQDLDRLTAFQRCNQVQLLPLPVYEGFKDAATTHAQARLLHSQAGEPGQVAGAGVASPLPWLGFRDADVMYDAAPATVRGRSARNQAPDADWYHEAAVYTVTHDDYGSRTFAVMADASGALHAWPLAARGPWLASEYADQHIKLNVPAEFARTITPPYPDWVYRPARSFREQWRSDQPNTSPDPRPAWAFHPFEPRAACIAVRRQNAPDTLHRSYETVSRTYLEDPYPDPFRVRLGDRLAQGKGFASSDKKTAPVSDRPGLVEFDLALTITGSELTDFTFEATLRDQFLAASSYYPVAVGYLAPVPDGWSSRGIAAQGGDRIEAWLSAETDPQVESLSAAWGGRWFTPMRRVSVAFRVAGVDLLRLRLIEDRTTERVDTAWSLHGHEGLDGFLSDLNLSQLTFVATWQKTRDQRGPVVDQRFATVNDLWNLVDRPVALGHLINREIETGVRVFHRGQIAMERRYGSDLELWATVDTPFDVPPLLALSVDEISTLWQYHPGQAAVHDMINWTGTCLYAAVTLRAMLTVVHLNTPAVNAALAQTSVNDLLAQAFVHGPDLTPPFTHTSLAQLWDGYSPAWFYAAIVPVVDRCWRRARQFLAQVPDPTDQGMRRFGRVVASAALFAQFPPWFWELSGGYDPSVTRMYPHVNGWPVGEQLFLNLWGRVFPRVATLRAVADHRGFLAVWLPVVYTTQPIPAAVEYSLLNDAFPALVNPDLDPGEVPDAAGMQATVWTTLLSRVAPTPPATVMGQAVMDVIRHENGGETTHAAAYNAAYGRALEDAELLGTPSVLIDPDTEAFVYRLSWPVHVGNNTQTIHIDMPDAPSMRSLFHYYTPRANGAALFV